MATKKSMFVLFGILMISACVLGSTMQAGAETMNFKRYSYEIKSERVPIDDVEGHVVSLSTRRAFWVFENGEVATAISVVSSDQIKGSGPTIQYTTITFTDGSIIISRLGGMSAGTAPGVHTSGAKDGEIIKATGRFTGIKGTVTYTSKYLPLEKGEGGQKSVGEGIISYALPK